MRQQFDPYPSQVEDVSYGILEDSSSVVGTGAPAKFKIPTIADGSGTSWTGTGFNDSAWTTHLFSGTRSVVISEISTGSIDWFEIQNVSGAAVNTTGWVVAINDGNVPQTINQVDPITWTIGPSMSVGETRYRTENSANTANYFGSAIDWPTTGSRGWVMIVDNTGKDRGLRGLGLQRRRTVHDERDRRWLQFQQPDNRRCLEQAPVSYAGTAIQQPPSSGFVGRRQLHRLALYRHPVARNDQTPDSSRR